MSASAALKEASEATNEVRTLSGTFSMVIDSRGGSGYFGGDFMMDGPNRMYMTMVFEGEQFEVLMVLPDMYVRPPGGEWARIDIAQSGIDAEAFQEYPEDRGVVDIDELAKNLEDSQRVPDEVIDGRTHEHYWGGFDYADVLSSAESEGIFTRPGLESLEGSTGDVRVETWIDAETRLPRRIVVDMDINVPALREYLGMKITMEFLQYNGAVAIPEPPLDAPLLYDVLQPT